MTKFLYATISPQIFNFSAILPTEWTITVSRCSRMPWFVYFFGNGQLLSALLCLFSATGFASGSVLLRVVQCLGNRLTAKQELQWPALFFPHGAMALT